jgi:Spy/CpxP family protein refolding chaperone
VVQSPWLRRDAFEKIHEKEQLETMKQIRQFLLLAVSMLSVSVWAQQSQPAPNDDAHHRMGQGKGHGHEAMSADDHLQMLSQKLNLTDDQKAKIKPIIEQHLQERQTIMKDQSLSREDKHSKMKASADSAHAQIEALLTDDQKKQFVEMMKDMHGEGKGMHGHGDHHGDSSKDNSSPK